MLSPNVETKMANVFQLHNHIKSCFDTDKKKRKFKYPMDLNTERIENVTLMNSGLRCPMQNVRALTK